MTRAGDMDATSEISGGTFTFVEEGTTNADSGWVISTDGAITLGTTAHTWTQFSGAGMITAGDGLTKSGNTLNANVDDATIKVVSDALQVGSSGTANQVLLSSGTAATAPSYGALPLANASAVSGVLAVANGGTGAATHTNGNVLLGAGANAITSAKAAPSGDFVGSSDTQTLTNKTLTSPTINTGVWASGNITSANATLSGGSISGMDITAGAGTTLDVDGAVDIDASGGNMDNVIIGATTAVAGTFTALTATGTTTITPSCRLPTTS